MKYIDNPALFIVNEVLFSWSNKFNGLEKVLVPFKSDFFDITPRRCEFQASQAESSCKSYHRFRRLIREDHALRSTQT